MNITDVRVRLMDASQRSRLLGFCTITIDGDFVVRDLKIIEGPHGPFVAMPNRKVQDRCGSCGLRRTGLLRLHLGTLRALEQGLRFDLDQLDRLALGGQALAEARELLGRFRGFHVGVALRSERFLEDALALRPAAPPPA